MGTIVDSPEESVLEQAYAWRCQQRRDWPAEADVWRFRQRWPQAKAPLREALLAGTYQGRLLSRVTLPRISPSPHGARLCRGMAD